MAPVLWHPLTLGLLPNALRYWALTTTFFVDALHSHTIPHIDALSNESLPFTDAYGNVVKLQTSLLAPAGASVVFQHLISKDDSSISVVMWACLAALAAIVIIFLTVMMWKCCGAPRHPGGGMNEPLKPGRGASSRCLTSRSFGRSSATSGAPSGVSEDATALDSPRSTAASIIRGQLPGLPLCPLLVVPNGTRLGCVVQNDVCRIKQELSFDVCAVPSRGGSALFRARVSELNTDSPGIYIETLGGKDQLAYLSTEDLWRSAPSPVLGISRPLGLPYGTMEKRENGDYIIVRGQTPLLTFAGDYYSHSIRVMVPNGHTIATTAQTSAEEYQVHMQARTDAGLVILGLLAIDKCEVGTGREAPAK